MFSEFWSDLRYRLRALFRRADVERELADELRFHIEREAEKLEHSGMQRDHAVRTATIAFGGVDRAKEASRDARGVRWIEFPHRTRSMRDSRRKHPCSSCSSGLSSL